MSRDRLPEWRYVVRRTVALAAVIVTVVLIADLADVPPLCDGPVCEQDRR